MTHKLSGHIIIEEAGRSLLLLYQHFQYGNVLEIFITVFVRLFRNIIFGNQLQFFYRIFGHLRSISDKTSFAIIKYLVFFYVRKQVTHRKSSTSYVIRLVVHTHILIESWIPFAVKTSTHSNSLHTYDTMVLFETYSISNTIGRSATLFS